MMFLLLALVGCGDPAPETTPAPVVPPTAKSIDTGAGGEVAEVDVTGRPVQVTDGKNRKPRLREITLEPEAPRAIDDIRARWTAKDPDGDRVKIDIVWYVNGDKLSGEEKKVLKAGKFKKNDKVYVEITASDGQKETVDESDPIIIANSPPEIELPRFGIDKIDGFQVKATDPDDDKLTFRLEEAPPGMSITGTGRLSFEGSNEQTEGGTFPTRIVVEDPDGEFAAWELQLTLNPGKGGGSEEG